MPWKMFIATAIQLFFFLTVTVIHVENIATSAPVVVDTEAYCPYFDNRLPTRQPNLLNCTWYKEYSCCTQGEIDVLFGITAPQGASDECLKWINYLMCWVCSPKQHLFYGYQRLSICENFCQNMFTACENATLEETPIGMLNTDGIGYCEDRKFLVKPNESDRCFDFDPLTELSLANMKESDVFTVVTVAIVAILHTK